MTKPNSHKRDKLKPIILARHMPGMMENPEYEVAKKYFDVVTQRTEVPSNRLVVGRYSVLPFYKELATDVRNSKSLLINSSFQHGYIADMMSWVADLKEMTPATWSRLEDVPLDAGPLVLKGQTNSRKERWATHMYAEDRFAAINVLVRLQEDTLIGSQRIYCRKYVPFKTYGKGLSNIPITHEFRVFVAYMNVVGVGYYWQNYVDDLEEVPEFDCPDDFLKEAIRRIGANAHFYALDVAKTEDGRWYVVEVNDGQMSGLSTVDPDSMYKNLRTTIDAQDFDIDVVLTGVP